MRKSFPLIKGGCYIGCRWLVNKIEGKDRVPATGSVIITPNHSSLLDGVLLTAYLNWSRSKPTHAIVHNEAFEHPFLGYILRSGQSIMLDRTSQKSIEEMFGMALAYLARGEAVEIFPEGHINNGVSMRLPRPGAALLALESGAPVLPVGLRGTRDIHSIGSKFNPKKRAQIYFGKLIDTSMLSKEYHDSSAEERKVLLDNLSSRIMRSIADLSGLAVHRRMK